MKISLIVLHCYIFDTLQSTYHPKCNGRKKRRREERKKRVREEGRERGTDGQRDRGTESWHLPRIYCVALFCFVSVVRVDMFTLSG